MPRTKRNATKKPLSVETDSEDDIPLKNLQVSRTECESLLNKKDQNAISSSSESDIENYLQPVDKIDLNSEFFKVNKKSIDDFCKVENDVYAGVSRLSDCSDSEIENESNKPQESTVKEKDQLKLGNTSSKLNFQQLEEYTRKIEEAKKHIEKYNSKKIMQDSKTNISKLLAAGESKKMTLENIKAEDLHPSDFESSEDDWEEVKIKDNQESKDAVTVSKKNLQISVDVMPGSCQKKKEVDLLAAMKRRLNRIRKENQVYVHQVHLLCWIAHGNYLNYIVNDTNVLGLALSLLPSDKCYPSDRTDLGYLEQIVQWYKKTITMKETLPIKELDLKNALKLQIYKKEAYNNRMYVLIFVAILRALGIQCRIVMSFQVEPLRPPASELHSLAKENPVKNVKEKKSTGNIGRRKINEKRRDVHVEIAKEVMKARETVKKLKSEEGNELELSNNKEKSNNKFPGKSNFNETQGKFDIRKSSTRNRKNLIKKQKEETLERSESKKLDSTKKIGNKNGNNSNVKEVSENALDPKPSNSKGKRVHKRMKDVPQIDGTINSDEENNLDLSSSWNKLKRSKYSNVLSKVQELGPTSMRTFLQVDGANDSPTKSKSTPNLKKLKSNQKDKCLNSPPNKKKPNLQKLMSVENYCLKKKHPSHLKLTRDQYDSENEFDSGIRSSKTASSGRLSLPSKPVDIKQDIINLIKGRITEQKHVDRSRLVNKRKPIYQGSEDSDSDYMPESIKKKYRDSDSDKEYFVPKAKVKRRIKVKTDSATGKKIISSESDLDESGKKKKKGINIWVEVFLEAEEKWISADIIKGQVHCVNELYARATHPISYIVAWNNNNTLKDVTQRYCKNFNTVTRKLRTDPKWWTETLTPFKGKPTARDKEEDDDLNRQQLDQPMPKSISEFKNHPLYALKRHLLKFEALYPPNAVPVGFIRGEAVYPRNCVYVCRSRDIWLKEAKVVKPGEKPYKIVKARPKWDKLSNKVINDQLLEIFGEWQTMDYEPPTAENGIVPRNAFGNVELFKACMLPKGTVHLKFSIIEPVYRILHEGVIMLLGMPWSLKSPISKRFIDFKAHGITARKLPALEGTLAVKASRILALPNLNRICKKLNIDCASAIVGFDFHGGWSHPTYDGFVICEEYEDQVIAAWELDREEMEKKETEKIEKRVFDNWKKLIKGMLIKQKLKAKYNFGDTSTKKKPEGKKKRRISSDAESE